MRLASPLIERLIVLLSFCVFFLALGVTTTLITFSASILSDVVAASILEGLSVPQTVYNHHQPTMITPAVESIFFLEPAIFDSSLFHPPISQR
jgi:hypothetical protein